MIKLNHFTLLEYSLFTSTALLISNELDATIRHINVDPDIYLYTNDLNVNLDFDNNGLFEVAIENKGWTTYDDPLSIYWQAINVVCNHSVRIAGAFYYAGSWLSYNFLGLKLNSGDLISSTLFYSPETIAQLVYQWTILTFGGGYAGGYWYPEAYDHFVGLQFADGAGNYHYGWIRCDVKDEGRTLVVKDYAYEKMPNTAIIAGDTVGKIPVLATDSLMHHYTDVPEENTLFATVYSFQKSLYIILPDVEQSQLTITDMAGKTVLTRQLNNKNEEVNLVDFPSGIYLVKLSQNSSQYIKKVILE